MEKFAIPAVGAIIEKKIEDEMYILIQTRQKVDAYGTNGLFEIPAGKIREYENIFDALRREIREETGLHITKIEGEDKCVKAQSGECELISFEPYCTTQNLSGLYSIIVHMFRCEAEGELLAMTDETIDIHWESVHNVRKQLEEDPESYFPMDLIVLRKYLEM